jgi:hypothetical protein
MAATDPQPKAASAEPQTTLDRDAVIQEERNVEARQAEVNFYSQEIFARQWEKLKGKLDKNVTGAEQSHTHARRQADDARKRADAMHKLARTRKEDAREDVLRTLHSQRDSFERRLIRAEDAAAHPDAYGPQENQTPPVWQAAIAATDELISEVEKWPTS